MKSAPTSSTLTPKPSSTNGFTLIEILVVVGLFILLAGLGLFMTMDAFRSTMHRSERDTIVSLLEKARSEAMNNMCIGSSCVDGKQHGVCYISPNYIIFQGNTCTAGASTNTVIPANPGVSVSGLSSSPWIVFDQLTGKLVPQLFPATNELRVTVSEPGRPDSYIYINNEGRINW